MEDRVEPENLRYLLDVPLSTQEKYGILRIDIMLPNRYFCYACQSVRDKPISIMKKIVHLLMQSRTYIVCFALCVVSVFGFVQTAYAQSAPQGLYFMTRFWISNNMLEKKVYYFSPDGTIYDGLQTGFSAQDLAAHKGPKGRYQLAGGKLNIRWADGSTLSSGYEPDKSGGGFAWDGGLFSRVKPFTAWQQLVGSYEGGESVAGAMASSSITLKADGTFVRSGIVSVSSRSSQSQVDVGSQSSDGGKWSFSGYTLQLADRNGRPVRHLVFPFDDSSTPIKPDRMYVGGTMYKRQ